MPTGRLVVAGVTSGVGKTTVALAIMYGLRKKGYRVQPFKVGPDFIDPSYHTLVTERPSRTLDPWLMRKQGVIDSFLRAVEDVDIAVIEGVMGIYDGMSGNNDFASTAGVAKMLDAPVILVIDASKAARSVAAIALGIITFDPKLRIEGIVINNLGSDKHSKMVNEAFDQRIRVPIVGMIRRNAGLHMEGRHLGLVPTAEVGNESRQRIAEIAKNVSEELDFDKIASIANPGVVKPSKRSRLPKKRPVGPKLGVALDESFNFYYVENIELLRQAGADVVFFSPVNDKEVPDVSGIIIGGGFPEVLADKLEKNRRMASSVSSRVHDGMPIYAECGGLMYLSRSISGYRGNTKQLRMAGVLDADTVMAKQLTLNYTLASGETQIVGRGAVRGHEFHYSKVDNISTDSKFAYRMRLGTGVSNSKDGFMVHNCLASYMHLHFAGKPSLAAELVKSCRAYSRT